MKELILKAAKLIHRVYNYFSILYLREKKIKPYVSRKKFWRKLIQSMNEKSSLYQNISPGSRHWISASSGVSGIGLNFVALKFCARAELYIDRRNKKENEFIFDELLAQREQIEKDFGGSLVWELLEHRLACRIKTERSGNVFNAWKLDSFWKF